jgi:hypothetical protein
MEAGQTLQVDAVLGQVPEGLTHSHFTALTVKASATCAGASMLVGVCVRARAFHCVRHCGDGAVASWILQRSRLAFTLALGLLFCFTPLSASRL